MVISACITKPLVLVCRGFSHPQHTHTQVCILVYILYLYIFLGYTSRGKPLITFPYFKYGTLGKP
jgi:hypothetical protein